MVVSGKMKDAVDQQEGQFRLELVSGRPRLPPGRLGRDHHVAQERRRLSGTGFSP
jgi:hypothetical protein